MKLRLNIDIREEEETISSQRTLSKSKAGMILKEKKQIQEQISRIFYIAHVFCFLLVMCTHLPSSGNQNSLNPKSKGVESCSELCL